jgi:hypothetical protein
MYLQFCYNWYPQIMSRSSYNLESNFAVGGTIGQYRLRYSANPSQADLLQTFLPAFETLVRNASLKGVMCSCKLAQLFTCLDRLTEVALTRCGSY